MDDTFVNLVHRLEQLFFFSGYPLIYAITIFIAGSLPAKSNLKNRLPQLLPFAYALTGTLYLGLQIRNIYYGAFPDTLAEALHTTWFQFWGILSVLFWIPSIAKNKALSLLHSSIFFYFILRDIFYEVFRPAEQSGLLQTDMKLYSGSLILNFTTLLLVALVYFPWLHFKKNRAVHHS